MTSRLHDAPPQTAPGAVAAAPRRKPLWKRVLDVVHFLVALAATGGFLAYLLLEPPLPPVEPQRTSRPAVAVVAVVGPGLIGVQPGSPLDKKIQVVTVRKQTITDPVLTVTGQVTASLRPGDGNDFWQFDSPEVLTVYTDWQKAQADITFAETKLAQIEQLAAAQLEAQKQVLARAEKGFNIGDGTAREVATEKANLLQIELTGRQEIHEAQTALRDAKRAEAAAAKQLQQSGLDPALLRSATSDMDIIVADVPEGWLRHVKVGQGCQATFFGIPNERFAGRVTSIAPVLSRERRSLRVLFVIDDPEDKLRPGMFAEIGLGTDPRDTLLAPADGVLHVGRSDYVLVGADANTWRVTAVQVGESHNGDVEILDGLKEGDRVIAKGAILFKPLAVSALQPSATAATEVRR